MPNIQTISKMNISDTDNEHILISKMLFDELIERMAIAEMKNEQISTDNKHVAKS